MVAFVVGGAALGLLLSCVNAGFAFADAPYHLRWAVLGLIGGLSLGALGFIIAWRSLGKRGGAAAGLLIGAVGATAAFVAIGLMGTPAEPPGPGVLGFGAFFGGLLFMYVGLKLGAALNEHDVGG